MPTPLTDAEILHEALVVPRRAFVRMPDMRVIERPGLFQIVTPSFRRGGLNEVCVAQFAEADLEASVDATIAEYRQHGIHFRWTVGPDSSPAALADCLRARGLAEVEVWAMAREIVPPPVRVDRRIRVEEVTAATVQDFVEVMARGWDIDEGPLRRYHEAVLADGGGNHPMFVAFLDDHPAGVAAYVAFPRSAYLLGAVVLEQHRGHGVYGALTDARLRHATARSLRLATTRAHADTSGPRLAGRGFRTHCRLSVFHGQ